VRQPTGKSKREHLTGRLQGAGETGKTDNSVGVKLPGPAAADKTGERSETRSQHFSHGACWNRSPLPRKHQ